MVKVFKLLDQSRAGGKGVHPVNTKDREPLKAVVQSKESMESKLVNA